MVQAEAEDAQTQSGQLPLGERRQRGLDDLAAVIEGLWGPRCLRNEGGCGCCTAWTIFDCVEHLTDASGLDDRNATQKGHPDDRARIRR